MVDCKILPNGDLEVTANEETREHIRENEANDGYWETLCRIFEPYWTNGSYQPFDAGEGNPNVGLTSAPCIAESMDVPDSGENVIVGRLWWYPNYMVRDPLDDLRDTGRTVFTLASEKS